ncbi:MAG: hypothetical protein HZT42_05995 [Paracoccaceae bacterium]|nr:MAG: hypothetical protein HZT42_05995 [Paracoccaceae bacterium]
MSLFKEQLTRDVSTTFFNPNEFSETVSFNGNLVNITFDEERLERFNRKNDEEGLTKGELLFMRMRPPSTNVHSVVTPRV